MAELAVDAGSFKSIASIALRASSTPRTFFEDVFCGSSMRTSDGGAMPSGFGTRLAPSATSSGSALNRSGYSRGNTPRRSASVSFPFSSTAKSEGVGLHARPRDSNRAAMSRPSRIRRTASSTVSRRAASASFVYFGRCPGLPVAQIVPAAGRPEQARRSRARHGVHVDAVIERRAARSRAGRRRRGPRPSAPRERRCRCRRRALIRAA